MIQVLYTVNGLRVNGVSAVIMRYVEKLPKDKYEFTLFTDEIADEFKDRLSKNRVNVIQSESRKKNQIAYYFELCRVIRKNHFDIIHAHGNSATIAIEMLAAKNCCVPVRIAHSHNTTCIHKSFDKLLRPLFYRTYTIGIGCGVEAGKWLFGNRAHQVIKNGVELQHFAYNEEYRKKIRTELQIENCYVIGHIGRFTDQKNHNAILRIFNEYIKIHDARLLLVGDGPREEEVKELAKSMGLIDKVIFYGTTKDTAPLYSAMDVFLFPSKFEGVPLTLIEAQANGLPCTISDKISSEVNLTDLITIKKLENESEWAECLSVDTGIRQSQSRKAITALTKHGFSIDDVIKQIDDLYTTASQGLI